MNRIEEPAHQELIIHCARVFYHLFGDVLRSADAAQVAGLARTDQPGEFHAA